MLNTPLSAEALPVSEPSWGPHDQDPARLERAVRDCFQFIWRCLRRFGVGSEDAVDDAAQRVFEIAAQKRELIVPGKERAFFFKTAVLVAAEARRAARRTREEPDSGAMLSVADPSPNPELLLDRCRSRKLLDSVLEQLPLELRAVFVLFELEGLATPEIAELLDLPLGTAASRLRRAREEFQLEVKRLQARLSHRGAL